MLNAATKLKKKYNSPFTIPSTKKKIYEKIKTIRNSQSNLHNKILKINAQRAILKKNPKALQFIQELQKKKINKEIGS